MAAENRQLTAVRRRRLAASAVLLAATVLVAAAPDQAGVSGRWLTQTRDGVITVAPCGGALCGFVTGMVYAGAPPQDVWHRSQCGLNLLIRMRPDGDGWSGRILDPDNGHTYAAHVRLAPDGTFKLHGYVGIPLFGATQTWTRFAGGPIGPACKMAGPGR